MTRKICFALMLTFIITAYSYAADNLQQMFSQGSVKGEIRLQEFTRDFDTTKTRKDMAIGGLLYYKTAPLHGISLGVSFATSNDVNSDDDDAVYGLLATDENGGHESLTRKQEYYIQGDFFKTTVKYGAQEINTPYLNTDDARLIPRSYKGLTVVNNSIDQLTLAAYYVTDSIGWNTENYVNVAEAVANEAGGASSIDDDKAVVILNATYKLPTQAVKGDVQAWYYTISDIFNISYLKAYVSSDFGPVNVYFMPSVLYQKSQGDELNGDLDASQTGFRLGAKFAGFDVTGAYSKSGDDGMVTPWGHDKIIPQQIMTSASRGNEDAWGVKLAYDFANIGVKGLSSYVWYGYYDVDETATSKDTSEIDYNIQYAFSGMLDGLGLRARYADVNVHDGNSLTDTRLYMTYKFAFSGM